MRPKTNEPSWRSFAPGMLKICLAWARVGVNSQGRPGSELIPRDGQGRRKLPGAARALSPSQIDWCRPGLVHERIKCQTPNGSLCLHGAAKLDCHPHSRRADINHNCWEDSGSQHSAEWLCIKRKTKFVLVL